MNRRKFFSWLAGSVGIVLGSNVNPKPQTEKKSPSGDWSQEQLNLYIAAAAITPNELRAIRGLKPFKDGGDDPVRFY